MSGLNIVWYTENEETFRDGKVSVNIELAFCMSTGNTASEISVLPGDVYSVATFVIADDLGRLVTPLPVFGDQQKA